MLFHVSVIMEGVIAQMRTRDRKLTEETLALAVDKDLDIVESDHFFKVSVYLLYHHHLPLLLLL